jgi:hypothetical protein
MKMMKSLGKWRFFFCLLGGPNGPVKWMGVEMTRTQKRPQGTAAIPLVTKQLSEF